MFEIAGVIILLALIVVALVIALLPQFFWALVIALWAVAIAVALIVGIVGLWSEVGPATILILSPVMAFLYWLGADKARWDRVWSFRK